MGPHRSRGKSIPKVSPELLGTFRESRARCELLSTGSGVGGGCELLDFQSGNTFVESDEAIGREVLVDFDGAEGPAHFDVCGLSGAEAEVEARVVR